MAIYTKKVPPKKVSPIIIAWKKLTSPLSMMLFGLNLACILFLCSDLVDDRPILSESAKGWFILFAAMSPFLHIVYAFFLVKKAFTKKPEKA